MRYGRYLMNGIGGGGGEPEVFHDETEFDVEFADYEIGTGYCQLQIQLGRFTDRYDAVTVDWGDGTVARQTSYLAAHNYTAVGRYTVRIGREARWFRVWDCYTVIGRQMRTARPQIWLRHWGDWLESAEASFCGWSDSRHGGLKGTLPRWGRSITSTYCCFEYCTDIEGRFPEWTDAITDASGTYQRVNLTGPLPRWGKNIERCSFCYNQCANVAGTFLPWPAKCVDTNSCYDGCASLVGEVPPWPECAEDIGYTYRNCPGLRGTIPAWPEGVRNLSGCYWNCTGLTGAWTDDPALLMPEAKLQDGWMNRSYDVVTGCADAVRALFWDQNWGGTIPRPIPLPEG